MLGAGAGAWVDGAGCCVYCVCVGDGGCDAGVGGAAVGASSWHADKVIAARTAGTIRRLARRFFMVRSLQGKKAAPLLPC